MFKKRVLTIEEQIEIIKRYQNAEKQIDISMSVGASLATGSRIWKNRKEILDIYEKKETETTHKTKRISLYLEKALVLWCRSRIKAGIPLNEHTLSTQACKIAKELGYKRNFCSKDWIRTFLNRQNNFPVEVTDVIEEPRMRPEKLEAKIAARVCKIRRDIRNENDSEAAHANINRNLTWLKCVDLSDTTTEGINSRWLNLRNKYSEDDIYNAEVIGLFYDLTPDKILEFKGQKCKEGELSQNRFTIFICMNMSGTDKRKLLIIGNKTVQNFKNTKEMDVEYNYNSKSWMTSEIFTTYIIKWDIELYLTGRKIILFANKGKDQSDIPCLSNIQLVFIPPNSDSALRRGIMRGVKTLYRQILLIFLNKVMKKNEKLNVSFPVAIKMLKKVWCGISKEYITHCFLKTVIPDALKSGEKVYSLSEWMAMKNIVVFKNVKHIEDFISIDDDIATTVGLTAKETAVESKLTNPFYGYENSEIS